MSTLISKFYSFILLLGLFLVASCTNLDIEETDSEVVEETEGGGLTGNPTQLLLAAYKDLSAYTDQANIYSLFEHTSDEMIPPTRGVDWSDNGVWRTLHTHNWDPTHSYVLGAWNQLNERSFRINVLLASSPSAQEAAEAKFIRAFNMWHIMDLYGKVPVREFDEGVDVNPRVMTRTEAFDFIVNDLTEALPDLPSVGPGANNTTASKAAARALLARLYLNKAVYSQPLESAAGPYTFDNGDMAKVIENVDAITADGYSLEPNYFDNFTPSATSELILVSLEGDAQNRYFMTLHYNQNPSGWNGFTTLADFYNTFEANDSRRSAPSPVAQGQAFFGVKRGFLIGQQVDDNGVNIIDTRTQQPLQFTEDVPIAGAATNKGIRVIKYHPGAKGKYILLRYADAYLMKVEALFRSGAQADALTQLNALRAARGASALGAITEADILNERGRELYWEGIRRVDQVRFGTFDDTWVEKTVTDPTRVLFPIPQQALDSNPNLTQNPGY
ncbi:MAG: RagB/SusD family nutrient uptake outer membrane protein [Microscillaceae bacterium]|nr:RagB/SusD family nutrient uptake outer membrane protein [Microscillaceae bacterium]